MKKIFNIAIVLILAATGTQSQAQSTNICLGGSTTITAINSSSLSNPTYSMNPGGVVSSNPAFSVSPMFTTAYTLYVTGLNGSSAVVTTSNIINVTVHGVSYSVVSPQNFSLGCGTHSVCNLNITNASAGTYGGSGFLANGGPVSYTLLAPGSSGSLPSGSLNSISSYSVNTPGNYTIVVKDNMSFCTLNTTINIVSNTAIPAVSSVTVSNNHLTCFSPTTSVYTTPNPNVQHSWFFPSSPFMLKGDSITVTTNSAAPNSSVAVTLTLEIADINNGCFTSSGIPIYQNIYPPNAIISGSGTGTCLTPSLVLTNQSNSTIPPALTATLPVVGFLWLGPAPQPSLSMTTTYVGYTSGTYTMIAQDMNNGCFSEDTVSLNFPGLVAAFAHTVSGGTVTFKDASAGSQVGTSFFWNFGDGTTSTLQNPTHNYSSSGAHIVKFKVSHPQGFCADSVIQAVTVSGIPCIANSGFSMVPTATPQVWTVIPSSPWNITAATWNWGDNSSSNTLYTSHQYSAAGMYTICLSVTVTCASTSSTCTSYSVYRSTQGAQIIQVNVTPPELISGLVAEADNLIKWDIVPNPNTGEFKVNLRNFSSESIHVAICDVTGRIVHERQVETTDILNFTTEGLNSGMYFVTLDNGKWKETKRMVVYR